IFSDPEKAAPMLTALTQQDDEDLDLRTSAARLIIEADPKSEILTRLATNYDKLPVDLRRRIASIAAGAKEAPGAAAFVVSFLKDNEKDLARYRQQVLYSVNLTLTPELTEVLTALTQDPDKYLKAAAESALKRLQK
ncbi:MAG TPA: hypothetical protein VM141_07470, partial [Planctomycetota bacterium]|nr:hypothetical protein [Planctomycetota bacterium]